VNNLSPAIKMTFKLQPGETDFQKANRHLCTSKMRNLMLVWYKSTLEK